jgi:hypothetical protein
MSTSVNDNDRQLNTATKRKLDALLEEITCPKITPEVEEVF